MLLIYANLFCVSTSTAVENHTSTESAGTEQPLLLQQGATEKVGVDGYCADDAFALLMSMNSVAVMVVSAARLKHILCHTF